MSTGAKEQQEIRLPSRFQHNDWVKIDVPMVSIQEARVIKVHFTPSHVSYDIEVTFNYQNLNGDLLRNPIGHTRFYNVDGAMLQPLDPNFKEWYDKE